MGSYQVAAFFHLVLAVLVTGYALFWAIMGLSLSTRFGPKEVLGHLDTVKASRWPHVIVPWKLRLPLPFVGWLLLGAIAVSGLATGYLSLSGTHASPAARHRLRDIWRSRSSS
jgi:hypothetical protein